MSSFWGVPQELPNYFILGKCFTSYGKIERFIYMCYSHTNMRHIRITLEDKEAELLDEVREKNNCTYRELILLSVKSKKR